MSSENTNDIPLLTFNSLYNVLREEKKSKALTNLPERFYDSLKKFIDDKKNEVLKLKNDTDKTKVRRERNILNNSKKIAKELVVLRSMKIATIAAQNCSTDEEVLTEENILEEEQKLQATLKENINSLLKIVENGN